MDTFTIINRILIYGEKFLIKRRVVDYFTIFNSLFVILNDIVFVLLQIFIDILLYSTLKILNSKKLAVSNNKNKTKSINKKSEENLSRMIIVNAIISLSLRLPELIIIVLNQLLFFSINVPFIHYYDHIKGSFMNISETIFIIIHILRFYSLKHYNKQINESYNKVILRKKYNNDRKVIYLFL